jgi:hypothetical protein
MSDFLEMMKSAEASASGEPAEPAKETATTLDSREQALVDGRKKEFGFNSDFAKMFAESEANDAVVARRNQRAYAEKSSLTDPDTYIATTKMLLTTGGRDQQLEVLRKLTPEQREAALKLAPGIAQQLGDDRGGAVMRTIDAVSRGAAGVAQPIMEFTGLGGTREEIDYLHKLNSASQEFAPARPDDPWYSRGALQAAEMAPGMVMMAQGGVLGGAVGKAAGTAIGRAAAAGVPGAKTVFQAAGAVGKVPTAVGLKGVTTKGVFEKIGSAAGVDVASWAPQYAQEVDSLKELGMKDGVVLRALAGTTAAAVGLIESIVPNPWKAGNVSFKQGAIKAARQYLWQASKNLPGEITEEGLQGIASGVGEHVAQYLDKDAKKKTIGEAFSKGWQQASDSVLPLVFMLGAPGVAGAASAAIRARREQLEQLRSKGFVSKEDAKKAGIEVGTRKEMAASFDAEIEDLKSRELVATANESGAAAESMQEDVTAPPPLPTQQQGEVPPPVPPQQQGGVVPPPLPSQQQGQVSPPPLPQQQESVPAIPVAEEASAPVGEPPVASGADTGSVDAIGERTKIMDTPVVRAKSVTDEDNVRYELFETEDAGGGIIRSTDMDSGQVVSMTRYPSIDKAKKEFGRYEKTATPSPAPLPQQQVDQPEPQSANFDAYTDAAWKATGKEGPVSENYKASQKQFVGSAADYGIQQGRVIAFDKKDGSSELQLAAIADELNQRGYEAGPVKKSRSDGVDNIEFSVTKKATVVTPSDTTSAGMKSPDKQPVPSPVAEKGVAAPQTDVTPPSKFASWTVQQGSDGKLYRVDPKAKTKYEKAKTRQPVDPAEVVVATQDQFGNPIDRKLIGVRQEFAKNAKPGAEFTWSSYPTAKFKVQSNGDILDITTGRRMGTVQSTSNNAALKANSIKWTSLPAPAAQPAIAAPQEVLQDSFNPETTQQPPIREKLNASTIRSPQEEVRQEEGGTDLRGSGQEQVRSKRESQEPSAQAEVQVKNTVDVVRQEPPVEAPISQEVSSAVEEPSTAKPKSEPSKVEAGKASSKIPKSPAKQLTPRGYLEGRSDRQLKSLAKSLGVKAANRKDAIDAILENPSVVDSLNSILQKEKPSKPRKEKPTPAKDTAKGKEPIPVKLRSSDVTTRELLPSELTATEEKQKSILEKMGVTLRLIEGGNFKTPGTFNPRSMTIWLDRSYMEYWDSLWEEQSRPSESMTWGLFLHEMFHAIKRIDSKAWNGLHDWISKNPNEKELLEKAKKDYVSDSLNSLKSRLFEDAKKSGKKADIKGRLFTADHVRSAIEAAQAAGVTISDGTRFAADYTIKVLSDEDLRNEEGLSRYLEEKAGDFNFWDELGRDKPSLLAKIGRWLRKALRFAEPDTLAGQVRLAIESAMGEQGTAASTDTRAAVAKQNERKARTLDEVRSRVAKDYALTVSPDPMQMINGQTFSSLDPDAVGDGLLIQDADASMRRMMTESLQEAGVPDEIASTVKAPSSAEVDYAFRLTNGSRYWYELSATGFVKDFFGLSRKLTEHLIDIVAGTSGGQKPTDNLRVAVASMSQDMQGRPVSVGTRDESSLTAALSPATLETHKFGNFSDTMQVLGGLRPGVKPLPTIDLQMAKVFGVQHAAIASDPRMYEAMSRFLIKLRDAQNATLKNGEQPYESWQIQALLWVAQRDTSDPDSFNIGMPKIVAQLKKAGIPTPGGKITEETLMDPRTSDVLAPTSKIIPEAYTATVETRTKLTKVGKESAEVFDELKAIDAPWARNLVEEFEKIQRRTMRAIGNRRPPKPGNKTRQKSVASMLLSVIMNKSPNSHELSRVDTDAWGTFEGNASPNIRFPLNLGAVGDTEEGGGTKRYVPTKDHREQFLSVLGKYFKQKSQAASEFIPADLGSHDTFSILVRRYDKVGITEAELAEISDGLGRPISYKQVPNGWQLDINIGGFDKTEEQKAESRDVQRVQAVMQKFALKGAVRYDILPRSYDSSYIEKSDYSKHIRRLENEIRQDTDTGGSGEAVGDTPERRASDYAAVVELIKGIAAEQESAFRKWTKDARELAAKRNVQLGNQRGADSGQRYSPGRRPESTGDGRGLEASRRYSPLEGSPSSQGATGPDPRIVDAAEQYARENGISLKRQAEYVKVDEDRAKRIAQAFENMTHSPDDPAVKEAYDDLIRQTKAQYEALVKAGYTFTFYDGKTDPYDGNPMAAIRDLRQNKTMAVYGTYDGYGTEGITDAALEGNPMLADTGLRWKDQSGVSHPVVANDLFRAVHDAFGHSMEGAGFRARGEENAWQAHVRLYYGPAIGAMTSETRGQNSWLNFGPYAEKNKTAGVLDTVFAENKIGLMPEWTWTEGKAADMESVGDEGDGDLNAPDLDAGTRFGVARPEIAKKLNSGKKVTLYRAMVEIDGNLYPPMSSKVKDDTGKLKMRAPEPIGKWMQAEERPDLVPKAGKYAGKFPLKKSQGTTWAAYAPYFHGSPVPLNDQFTAAWKNDGIKRPRMVIVEVEIPASELTSGYQAEGSKKKTGVNKWNSGVVGSRLPNGRDVVLSRYVRIKRVVPDAEVAKKIAELVVPNRLSIPVNTVTPQLRAELEKNGVRISPKGTKGDDVRYSPGRKKKDDILAALYKQLEEKGVIKPQVAGDRTTSIKNRKTDELRAESGLPPRVRPARESFEMWEEEARRRYPTAKDRLQLVAEVEKDPEQLGKIESAAIGQHIAYLDNQRRAGKDVFDELRRTIKAANIGGTEAGRALVSRKAERFSDYSLAGLVNEHFSVVGSDPTDAQMQEYSELANRIEKLEKDKVDLAKKLAKETIARKKAEAELPPKQEPPKEKIGTKRATLLKKVADGFAAFQNAWGGKGSDRAAVGRQDPIRGIYGFGFGSEDLPNPSSVSRNEWLRAYMPLMMKGLPDSSISDKDMEVLGSAFGDENPFSPGSKLMKMLDTWATQSGLQEINWGDGVRVLFEDRTKSTSMMLEQIAKESGVDFNRDAFSDPADYKSLAKAFVKYLPKYVANNPDMGSDVKNLLETSKALLDPLEYAINVWEDSQQASTFDRAAVGRKTETSAFKKWFGDSKITKDLMSRDKQQASTSSERADRIRPSFIAARSAPLVVYHGSPGSFTSFDQKRFGSGEYGTKGEIGFYFSPEEALALEYGSNVIKAFIRIENPLFVSYEDGAEWEPRKLKREIQSGGHDGAVFLSSDGRTPKEFMVLSPTQIKSATSNTGTFDSKNPDIRYSPGRQEPDIKSAAASLVATLREAGVSSMLELESQVNTNMPNVTPDQMQVIKDAWEDSNKKDKVTSPIGANPQRADIAARAKELMRSAIELGYGAEKENWMDVVDVVHDQLSLEVPGIDKYDTMQAISDYGVWRELPPEQVEVIIRAVRGKARQSLKIEDALKAISQSKAWLKSGVSPEEVATRLRDQGLLPKATGQERATPDSIERDLIAEFNKLKKTLPVPAESREGQLKSALTTAKTAASNRLEMLDKDIASLQEAVDNRRELAKPVAEKSRLEPDAELASLRSQLEGKRRQRDELKAQYEKIFPDTSPKKGRKQLTDEQKIEASVKLLRRQIDAVKADVQSLIDGTWVAAGKSAELTSERKEELKAELASLRASQKQARQASPAYQAREEAKYWERYRKSQEKRLAFWMKRRDEAQAGRLPVPLQKRTITEKSIIQKNMEIEEAQYEAMIAIEKANRATWNAGQWIGQGILEATSLIPKTLMLGMEMSFVLRQGFFYTYSQPMKAFNALVESMPAVFSQRLALASMENIESRANAQEYHLAGVDFTSATGPKAKLEEMYQSSIMQWLERTETKLLLPLRTWAKVYAMFERGNRVFSNIMKADMYDIQKRDTLAAREFFGTNTDWTDNDIKQVGRTVNIFSGRGTGLKGGNPWLDWLFLARRWTWSRIQADFIVPFQLATPQWIGQWNADRGMRVALAKLYIQAMVGHAAKMAAAYFAYSVLAGDDEEEKPTMEFDLRSSDALALKIGETRLKDEGGLMPAVVLAARLLTGEIKTGKGEIKSIYGADVDYGGKTAADFVINYGRYKLGTAPSAILEWISGRDAVGNVMTKTDIVKSRLTPLTWREIYAAESELGLKRGTLAALEAFFGVSVSTHGDETKYKKANETDRLKQFETDLKRMEWDSPDPPYKDLLTADQMEKVKSQRDHKKQTVVYEAFVNPVRKNYKSDDSHKEAVEKRDKFLVEFKKSGLSFEESRKLLVDYWKRNYGSPYETKNGVSTLKEGITNRLRQLKKTLSGN